MQIFYFVVWATQHQKQNMNEWTKLVRFNSMLSGNLQNGHRRLLATFHRRVAVWINVHNLLSMIFPSYTFFLTSNFNMCIAVLYSVENSITWRSWKYFFLHMKYLSHEHELKLQFQLQFADIKNDISIELTLDNFHCNRQVIFIFPYDFDRKIIFIKNGENRLHFVS